MCVCIEEQLDTYLNNAKTQVGPLKYHAVPADIENFVCCVNANQCTKRASSLSILVYLVECLAVAVATLNVEHKVATVTLRHL